MLARVDGSTLLEIRPLTMAEVPEHKRYLWRPVIEEGEGEDRKITVASDHVRIVRSPRPKRESAPVPEDTKEARIAVLEAKVAALLEAIQTAGGRP